MSTHNLCFEKKYEKYQNFLSENFHFLEVKFSIYLNRHVFVMSISWAWYHCKTYLCVGGFICGVCLVNICSSSLLLLRPWRLKAVLHNCGISWVSSLIAGLTVWLSWMRVQLVIRRLQIRLPLDWQHSFKEIWSWNIFYCHSLPSADSRRAVVSFWWKNVHNTGQPLRGLSLPSKSVVR